MTFYLLHKLYPVDLYAPHASFFSLKHASLAGSDHFQNLPTLAPNFCAFCCNRSKSSESELWFGVADGRTGGGGGPEVKLLPYDAWGGGW